MADKIIIGIAGDIGAGKGTLTSYLVQSYHAYNVRYSGILQDILRRLSLTYNRENPAILAEALRTTFGGDVLSRALVEDIKHSDAHVIVVDGIRKEAELEVLKTLPGFVFIFVDAAIETRYKRIHTRNEKADDATKTFEEFVTDHERAADRDVPQLKALADFVVDNNDDDMAQVYAQMDAAIAQLRQ